MLCFTLLLECFILNDSCSRTLVVCQWNNQDSSSSWSCHYSPVIGCQGTNGSKWGNYQEQHKIQQRKWVHWEERKYQHQDKLPFACSSLWIQKCQRQLLPSKPSKLLTESHSPRRLNPEKKPHTVNTAKTEASGHTETSSQLRVAFPFPKLFDCSLSSLPVYAFPSAHSPISFSLADKLTSF